MNKKICAVVVTFNRIDLLKECICELRNQSRKLDGIIVVNNDSKDGTKEWLESQDDLSVIHQKNLGGAGGFNAGIKNAYEKGYDWIWCMDDDVFVNGMTLKNLVASIHDYNKNGYKNIGWACSNVLWTDGTPNKLNMPQILSAELWPYKACGNYIYAKSCSFTSVLLSKEAVKKCGLPIKDFFIYLDDSEYTARITNQEFDGLFVINSTCLHKTEENNYFNASNLSQNTIEKYRCHYRNYFFFLNTYYNGKAYLILYMFIKIWLGNIMDAIKYKKYIWLPFIFYWFFKGIFFKPSIEFPSIK